MDKRYFNVIRLYPKYNDTYSFINFTSESYDMEGYDRWIQLRQSNTIKEVKDVFILINKTQDQLESLKTNLIKFNNTYVVEFNKLKFEYGISKGTHEDYLNFINKVNLMISNIKLEFTNYITTNYIKLEF